DFIVALRTKTMLPEYDVMDAITAPPVSALGSGIVIGGIDAQVDQQQFQFGIGVQSLHVSSMLQIPLCACGVISAHQAALKEGVNKGRIFFVYSQRLCGFFQWTN
ncbi:MAG: hypothetical protein ACKPKO_25450, partial [Candidatus Fonsibacter sp.]